MKKTIKIHWLDSPKDGNYPASESYLSLIFDKIQVETYIKHLNAAPIVAFKAKDIFRSSGLSLLGVSNTHVKRDMKKIDKEQPLSPIILVRQPTLGKVIIADGYHRLCAVYRFDEDALVPCKIV